ncbi:MAG TPA: tRNA (adenosine(37)-N6)-threonylcarbamoyltransferase complex dimerization subunit type 1 TsaB [Parachlamydiaceae bacterium]|nr:tRNA (adenosine(37)-N6)-threonylcarbamoyltransferase complex dimerization subunit type 1 TsaB [Parachlamydiaceae bacterium]
MLGLVIETSTERAVAAIFNGTECLFYEELPFGIQNSHLLLPDLQKKIAGKSFKIKDLDFISVGIGPGSYTGIRIGVTIAKILAFALDIPLVGICTLDAFIPEKEGVFAALIDAKIGGVYLQTGRLKNNVVELLTEPKAYSLAEAAEVLHDIPTIVTPNADKIRSKLEALKPQNGWHWQERYPQVAQLVRIAHRKMEEGNVAEEQHLELLYMRKTQAEIERDLKKSVLS